MDYNTLLLGFFFQFMFPRLSQCFTESSQEVCHFETFHAQCPRGEVIFITKAFYGHIEVGRCVELETEQLGCKADVTSIISAHCDGRSECRVEENDDEIKVLQPCSRGVYMYLDTSYICVAGKQVELCKPIMVSNDKSFISSKQIHGQTCPGPASLVGVKSQLTASNGRQIEISAVGFSPQTRDSDSEEIGYVLEGQTDAVTALSVTPNGGRERVLMRSESNTVSLSFHTDTQINFLIFFRASGCEDMQEPRNMWLNRDGDQLTVGCHNSRKTWRLRCEGVHWRGVIGNCTKEPTIAVAEIQVMEEIRMVLPRDVVLMIIFAGTAIIALIIVTAGYVSYKRSTLTIGVPQLEGAIVKNNIKSEASRDNTGSFPSQPQGPQYTLMRLQENPTQSQPPPVPPRKDNLSAQTTLLMREA